MSKFFLKSKTVQGLILMVIGIILRATGVGISDETLATAQLELMGLYPELMEFIGLVWASYGRVKATGAITLTGGK